jgi:hypothetical protein
LEVPSWRKAVSPAEAAASGRDECMMPPNRTAFAFPGRSPAKALDLLVALAGRVVQRRLVVQRRIATIG